MSKVSYRRCSTLLYRPITLFSGRRLVCCPANNVHLSASYPGSCGQARRGGIAVAIATSCNAATRRGSRRETCIYLRDSTLARQTTASTPACDSQARATESTKNAHCCAKSSASRMPAPHASHLRGAYTPTLISSRRFRRAAVRHRKTRCLTGGAAGALQVGIESAPHEHDSCIGRTSSQARLGTFSIVRPISTRIRLRDYAIAIESRHFIWRQSQPDSPPSLCRRSGASPGRNDSKSSCSRPARKWNRLLP